MISLNDYKNSFQVFQNIDSNSWIDFEEKELLGHALGSRVIVPCLSSKPPLFVRVLYWIFDCIIGASHSERVAKKLIACLKISACVIKESTSDMQLQAQEVTKILLKKLTRDPEIQRCQIQEIDGIRAGLSEAHLGPKNREIAYSMDWSKDDPILFDPTYMNDLVSEAGDHPDMQTSLISEGTKATFLNFIHQLMTGQVIQDHYRVTLSPKNTDRIRQMMLAIMNQVNAARREPHFQEFYASIIDIICLALDNCSNRMNTEIENVFMKLNYPKEGSLGVRVRLALQEMRAQIFQRAIHLCVSQDFFYLQHEGGSFNYYYGKMTKRFGLPSSISALDHHFRRYAMQDQEEKIGKYFDSGYTPYTIFKKLSEVIQDPNDSSIPCKLFTDWVEANYRVAERYDLLDDTGKYKPECFIKLFKELQIFE